MGFMRPREYGRLLFLVFFKSRSLQRETAGWNSKRMAIKIIQANLYNLFIAIIIISLIESSSQIIGFQFNFINATGGIAFGILWNIIWGIVWGIIVGIAGGIAFGIAGSILMGIAGGIEWGIAGNIAKVIEWGLTGNIVKYIAEGISRGIEWGIVMGIAAWGISWVIGLGIVLSIPNGPVFFLSYFIIWSRWFYIPVYLFTFLKRLDLKRLPLHWDENIFAPLPFLGAILLHISVYDRTAAIEEAIFLIRERPTQRRAAQYALVKIALKEMAQFRDLRNIARMHDELDFLPHDKAVFPEFYNKGYKTLSIFARDSHIALNELNLSNRLRMLERLEHNILKFQKEMDFAKKDIGVPFGRIASRWSDIVKRQINSLEADVGRPLPNPFITGRPIDPESEMFVGRRDIIDQIQQEALREGGGGAILFIGRRRTGKTSTLFNLKPHLLTCLKPVYVDCQETVISQNVSYFSNTVARSICFVLSYEEGYRKDCRSLEDLTGFLQRIQVDLGKKDLFLLLCFDEFERLTEKIVSGDFIGLPDAFRYWVQHLPRVICLFCGSHSLNEIGAIDWTDYLINVRNIHISFLDFDSALRLVTKPIPKFDLAYDPDLKTAKRLIQRLGCQPFLLQATMSELVNHLNRVKKKTASQADIDCAIVGLFEAYMNYFEHIWKSETSDPEKEALIAIIKKRPISHKSETHIRSLIRKEVLREEGDNLAFWVPVFKEWICKHQIN